MTKRKSYRIQTRSEVTNNASDAEFAIEYTQKVKKMRRKRRGINKRIQG